MVFFQKPVLPTLCPISGNSHSIPPVIRTRHHRIIPDLTLFFTLHIQSIWKPRGLCVHSISSFWALLASTSSILVQAAVIAHLGYFNSFSLPLSPHSLFSVERCCSQRHLVIPYQIVSSFSQNPAMAQSLKAKCDSPHQTPTTVLSNLISYCFSLSRAFYLFLFFYFLLFCCQRRHRLMDLRNKEKRRIQK